MAEIQVTAGSRPKLVAASIVEDIRNQARVVLQAAGAGAVNQAIKAVAIAIGFLDLEGIRAICIPTFAGVEVDGHERRAIRITVEARRMK